MKEYLLSQFYTCPKSQSNYCWGLDSNTFSSLLLTFLTSQFSMMWTPQQSSSLSLPPLCHHFALALFISLLGRGTFLLPHNPTPGLFNASVALLMLWLPWANRLSPLPQANIPVSLKHLRTEIPFLGSLLFPLVPLTAFTLPHASLYTSSTVPFFLFHFSSPENNDQPHSYKHPDRLHPQCLTLFSDTEHSFFFSELRINNIKVTWCCTRAMINLGCYTSQPVLLNRIAQ